MCLLLGKAKKIQEKNIKKLAYEIDKAYFTSFSPGGFNKWKMKSQQRDRVAQGKKKKASPKKKKPKIENALDILKQGL